MRFDVNTLLLLGLGAWLLTRPRAVPTPVVTPEGAQPVTPVVGPQMPFGPEGPVEYPVFEGFGRTGGTWRGIGRVPCVVRG